MRGRLSGYWLNCYKQIFCKKKTLLKKMCIISPLDFENLQHLYNILHSKIYNLMQQTKINKIQKKINRKRLRLDKID